MWCDRSATNTGIESVHRESHVKGGQSRQKEEAPEEVHVEFLEGLLKLKMSADPRVKAGAQEQGLVPVLFSGHSAVH